MKFGARVLMAGQAASAEADGCRLEVAAVFLDHQVGGGLAYPKQRVGRAIDRHLGGDSAVVGVVLG